MMKGEKARRHPNAVIWFGIPAAILMTIVMHGESYGYEWSKLASAPFFILLASNLVFMGWFGGRAMQWVFARAFR